MQVKLEAFLFTYGITQGSQMGPHIFWSISLTFETIFGMVFLLNLQTM